MMAAAYATASSEGRYPVLSQQIFYAARPKILEMTGKDELRPGERSRFCYVLLPQFIQEHVELTAGWRILYKPRGELIEPHTDRRVGLGTSEVATYRSGWTNGLLLGDTDIDVGESGSRSRQDRTTASVASSSSRREGSLMCSARWVSAGSTTWRSSAMRVRALRPS